MSSEARACGTCGDELLESGACPRCTPTRRKEAAATATPASAEARDERIGEFRVVRLLGHGGMGSVYEAEQPSLHRRVALKVLEQGPVEDEEAVKRFDREAWVGGRLSHPGIVKVLSSGTDGRRRYVAMELLPGGSLRDALDEKRRKGDVPSGSSALRRARVERMVSLFVGVADALAHVHAQGVVHRDVKPANLLFTEGRDRLLLSDFGLARDPEASRITRRGDFMGTLQYMSPEQLLAHRAGVDHRSDVWSLGVTLYEALTLALPHEAQSEEALVAAIATRPPVPARRRLPSLPRDLETILGKCLEKDPGRRYQSAGELRDDLARYLRGEPVVARRPGVVLRAARFAGRHRVAVVAAVVVAAVVTAGGLAIASTKARDRDMAAIRTTLEEVLRSGRDAVEVEPDWERLEPILQRAVADAPESELGQLALRAATRVSLEIIPLHGTVSEPPAVSVSLSPPFDLGRRHDHVGLVKVSVDGAPEAQVVAIASRPWIDGDVSTTNGYGGGRSHLVLPGLTAPGPHHLAATASLWRLGIVDDLDWPGLGNTASALVLGDEEVRELDTSATSSETRALGEAVVTIFDEFPTDFPRTVHDDAAASASLRDVTRLVILRRRLPAGERSVTFHFGGVALTRTLPDTWPEGQAFVEGVVLVGWPNEAPPVPIAGRLEVASDGRSLLEMPFADGMRTGQSLSGQARTIGDRVRHEGWTVMYYGFTPDAGDALAPVQVHGLFWEGGAAPPIAPESAPARALVRIVPSRDAALACRFDSFLDSEASNVVDVILHDLDGSLDFDDADAVVEQFVTWTGREDLRAELLEELADGD